MKTALAWIGLPAAVLLHSITAWIFGLQISRGLLVLRDHGAPLRVVGAWFPGRA